MSDKVYLCYSCSGAMTYAPMQVICSYRSNLIFPLQVECDQYQEVSVKETSQ
jgi:hypothetical protein